MLTILIVAILGYILGSIPTGVWLGKAFKGIDVREHGSKTTGATNVFRVLGAKLAIVVLIVDILKGFAAAFLAARVNLGDTILTSDQLAIISGLLAIVGHLFPLFAGFHGGKGVATGAGILLFLAPLEVAFAIAVFIITIALTRYVSLGSILATIFFALAVLLEKYAFGLRRESELTVLSILLVVLILYTHRANIGRLLRGRENKIGAKAK